MNIHIYYGSLTVFTEKLPNNYDSIVDLAIRDVKFLSFKVSDEVGNKESRYKIQLYLDDLFNINEILLVMINKCRDEFLPYKDKEE